MSTRAVHNDAQVVFDLLMFGPITFEFMTVWKQYLFNRPLLFVFLQATEHSHFSFSRFWVARQKLLSGSHDGETPSNRQLGVTELWRALPTVIFLTCSGWVDVATIEVGNYQWRQCTGFLNVIPKNIKTDSKAHRGQNEEWMASYIHEYTWPTYMPS